MSGVRVRVPSKINLQLSVGPRREDGYHSLVTVFHAVSLMDEVTAISRPAGSGISLSIEGEGAGLLPLTEENIAWRAVTALATRSGVSPDVHLQISKGIPVAGGMAGGSADAAAALVACDALWRTALGRVDLDALAAQLGSDVTFLLHGGTAVGTGRGEVLSPVLTRSEFHWVIALADGGLSTASVYGEYDRLRPHAPEPNLSEPLMHALRAGDAVAVGAALSNDLQAPALSLRPSLRRTLDTGMEEGALGGLVSGSGPTCVFLARDAEHALDLTVALSASGTCRSVRRAVGPVTGATVITG